jgi:hypothetical protein
MFNLLLPGVLPNQYQLSRHAADRYAVLTALNQPCALNRRSSRPIRIVRVVRQLLAIQD